MQRLWGLSAVRSLCLPAASMPSAPGIAGASSIAPASLGAKSSYRMMATSADFWDKMAETYAAAPVKNVEGYEDTISRVRNYLRPGSSVLEVRCGTGSTALKLADLAVSYVATDYSAGLISICRQRQSEGEEGKFKHVDFQFADIRSLDTSKTQYQYDAVVVMNTLHLLPEPQSAVDILRKVLKPGGLFVSKTHALGNGNFLMKLVVPVVQFFGKAPHISYMTRDEISKIHTDAGLQIIETKDYEKGARRLVIARKN